MRGAGLHDDKCARRTLRCGRTGRVFLAAAFFVIPSSARAATDEQVQSSIAKATDYLLFKQHKGTWESKSTPPTEELVKKSPTTFSGGQWAENTSLATWALLAAGRSPQDDRLIPAIQFLQTTPTWGTYALGAKTQIYPFLPPSDAVRRQAEGDLQKLLDAQFDFGAAKGLYDSLLHSTRNTRVDHSVSLYGVLGALACEQAGAEVPIDYWKKVEDAWQRDQDASGGWSLERHATARFPLSASMTAAALSVLYITQDHLHADVGAQMRGNITSPHLDTGLAWLTANYDKVLTEKDNRYSPYGTLFDIEHVGMASGLKFFGSVDWYHDGCDYLIQSQRSDGSWNADLPSTSFAILFLAHGRAPIVLNKLQYDTGGQLGNWNQRPRDAANLAHYIGQQIEHELNWQVVNLDTPTGELHDAPILYIAGNQALSFTADEQSRLKQFCEEGGLILGNADGASPDFSASFRALGAALFPDYEFRQLPDDSPIYTNEQYFRSSWPTAPAVLSLSNGVREMMVLIPDSDPARYWQLDAVTGREAQFQVADDIFLYAVDKQNLLAKGKTYLAASDPSIKPTHKIKLARLAYDGNYNPEPAGWQRLTAILRNDAAVQLVLLPVKLGANKLGNGHGLGAHVAHLTGTTRFKLDDAARSDLKKFIDGGGTLIVDAAGGSADFADAAQAELTAIFGPDVPRQLHLPLFQSNPVFNLPGGAIKEFTFRPYTKKIAGDLQGPQLRVITLHDRPAIYFSREDLSAGLVGENVDGIIGYDPPTATALMRNLIVTAALGPTTPVGPTDQANTP
jgi:hypothetical protein